MAVKRMLLLLALAACVAVHAAESQPSAAQSGSFVDWITKQSSTQAQLASAADDAGTSVCLQDMRLQNCRCLSDSCKRAYAETQLTRCSTGGEKFHSNLDDLRAKALSVGGCTFTEEFFDTPLTYESSETTKLGQFSGTCEMKEEAAKCDGGVLCEGTTLLISGDILGFPRIAFEDGLSEPISACEADSRAQSPMRIALTREKRGLKSSGAYSVGAGAIYVGNVQVFSNRQNMPKYGRFQQVVATGSSFERAMSPPERSFVAKDLVTKLDLF